MPVIVGSGLITVAVGLVAIILAYRDLSHEASKLHFLKTPGTPQKTYSDFAVKVRVLWPIAIALAAAGILTIALLR